MRLFLAINLPSSTVQSIDRAVDPLRAAAPALRWVPPERWHLTVRFIGEPASTSIAEIGRAVDVAVRGHAVAPLAIGGVGAFPSFRRARVVWLGIAPDPRLELLHHDIESACIALGMEPEGRPFRPHLTLARVPVGTDPPVLRALSRTARAVRYGETIDADSVDLMASESVPGGRQYTLLHSLPLRAAH